MNFPKDLFYTKDHEWAQKESNGIFKIGITDHAQESLGDIVYLELPEPGRHLKAHETFGVVESIKAVSDLYSPITGEVKEANTDLVQDPAKINQDPYTNGWLIRLSITDESCLKDLMNADEYAAFVQSLR